MRSIKRALLFGLGLASGFCVALFLAANTEWVEVQYLPERSGSLPISILVLIAFCVGAIVPVLIAVASGFETLLDRRRLNRRIHALEEELVELRNLPLTEAGIDLERPRPPVRPIVEEPREVVVEVMAADELGRIKEADLYPAVYDKSKS